MTTTPQGRIAFQQFLRNLDVNFTRDPGKDEMKKPAEKSQFYMDVHVHFLLYGSIALFGAISNTINMTIFFKLGLRDSMSVNLMALSFTDFLLTTMSITGIAYFIWDTRFSTENDILDGQTIEHVSIGWYRDIVFLCSSWITTALSIERCVCVVFPFKVKQVFTRTRSIVVVVSIYVIHISFYLPVFLSQWLSLTKIEVDSGNGTIVKERLAVTYGANRAQIQLFIDIFTGAVSPIPSFALVCISVLWLIYGLRRSSRVRNRQSGSENVDEKAKSQLNAKEERLVKVVLLIAIILTLCSIPRFLAIYAKQIFPEVSFGKESGDLYMFLSNMATLGCIINSSVNIFVYLTINTNYREKLQELIRNVLRYKP